MIKISNKTFYKNHDNELKKYLVDKKTLHIINSKSDKKLDFKNYLSNSLKLTCEY